MFGAYSPYHVPRASPEGGETLYSIRSVRDYQVIGIKGGHGFIVQIKPISPHHGSVRAWGRHRDIVVRAEVGNLS